MNATDPAALVRQLQSKLARAMRDRDRDVVMALRDGLAALANAEAIPAEHGASSTLGDEHFAGSIVGVGANEAPRRSLSGDDARRIIDAVIDARREGAADLDARGRRDEAAGLRRGAAALESVANAPLGQPGSGPTATG